MRDFISNSYFSLLKESALFGGHCRAGDVNTTYGVESKRWLEDPSIRQAHLSGRAGASPPRGGGARQASLSRTSALHPGSSFQTRSFKWNAPKLHQKPTHSLDAPD